MDGRAISPYLHLRLGPILRMLFCGKALLVDLERISARVEQCEGERLIVAMRAGTHILARAYESCFAEDIGLVEISAGLDEQAVARLGAVSARVHEVGQAVLTILVTVEVDRVHVHACIDQHANALEVAGPHLLTQDFYERGCELGRQPHAGVLCHVCENPTVYGTSRRRVCWEPKKDSPPLPTHPSRRPAKKAAPAPRLRVSSSTSLISHQGCASGRTLRALAAPSRR